MKCEKCALSKKCLSVLRHEQEHSRIEITGTERSQVLLSHRLHHRHRDVIAGFTRLIKFLGDKLLYGHVPDPFPRCGIGSGHARLNDSRSVFPDKTCGEHNAITPNIKSTTFQGTCNSSHILRSASTSHTVRENLDIHCIDHLVLVQVALENELIKKFVSTQLLNVFLSHLSLMHGWIEDTESQQAKLLPIKV